MNHASLLLIQDCAKILKGEHEAFKKGSKKVNDNNTALFIKEFSAADDHAQLIAEDLRLFPKLASTISDLDEAKILWISTVIEASIKTKKKY